MEQINEAAKQPQTGGKRLKKGGAGKPLAILGILVALAAAAYLGLCAFAHYQTVFYPNYSINGLDVSGLTAEEARDLLAEAFPAQTVTLCDAEGGAVLGEVTLADMGVTSETSVGWAEEAMARQNHTFLLYKGGQYLGSLLGFSPLGSVYDCALSEESLTSLTQKIEESLHEDPVHTAYALKENALSITVPATGQTLDTEALAADLATVSNTVLGPRKVFVSRVIIPATTMTAQQIHRAVSGEMKNAGYDKETDSITPEQIGADFDVPAAQKAMDSAEPGSTIEVPAEIEYPSITAEALKEVLFRDVLAEYTTKVSGTTGRRGNVRLSAASINNYVMNSGDVFSYNEAVGQRTAANGYAPAPAYVKGETVDEIGGGICQTSSTLYLTCLLADLEITERYAHRYAPAYVPLGMDATVSWGGPDYKFTNNTDYPIRIETIYENHKLTVRIHGTKVDGSYAKVTYEYLGKTDWQTVYQEDPTIAPGTQQVKTEPYTGHKVKTYHTIYAEDGTVLDSHYEATSDYKVRNKVILVAPGQIPTPDPSIPAAAPENILAEMDTPEPSVEPPVSEIPPAPVVILPEESLTE